MVTQTTEARGSKRAYEKSGFLISSSLSHPLAHFSSSNVFIAQLCIPRPFRFFGSSFSLGWINAPHLLIHLPLLSVFSPSPNYSKHHTSRSASSVTPRRDFAESKGLRDLERTSWSFDLVKEGDHSSSPHCYHHQSVQILQLCSPLPSPPNPTDFLQDFSKYFAWKWSEAVPGLSAVYMDSG